MGSTRVRVVLYFFAALTFLAGVLALGYPYLADYINELHTSKMYAEYVETVRAMGNDESEAMFEEARVFNRALAGNSLRWMPDGVELDEYLSVLDTTGTGIIGYIEVPKINIRLPIYHTTDDTVLQIAVGHMVGSSFPIGEKGCHAVLSGHNGMIKSPIFTELGKVGPGDMFYVTVLGNKLEYVVSEVNTVLPGNFDHFGIDPEKDLVTLVTCTPFGVNSHRLLVRGERVDYSRPGNRIQVRFD